MNTDKKIAEYRKTVILDYHSKRINKKKAGYTATPVACGWAGAVFELTKAFGQEHYVKV